MIGGDSIAPVMKHLLILDKGITHSKNVQEIGGIKL